MLQPRAVQSRVRAVRFSCPGKHLQSLAAQSNITRARSMLCGRHAPSHAGQGNTLGACCCRTCRRLWPLREVWTSSGSALLSDAPSPPREEQTPGTGCHEATPGRADRSAPDTRPAGAGDGPPPTPHPRRKSVAFMRRTGERPRRCRARPSRADGTTSGPAAVHRHQAQPPAPVAPAPRAPPSRTRSAHH